MEERAGRGGTLDAPLLDPRPTPASRGEEEKARSKRFARFQPRCIRVSAHATRKFDESLSRRDIPIIAFQRRDRGRYRRFRGTSSESSFTGTAVCFSPRSGTSLPGFQRSANYLPLVAGEHMTVCKGWRGIDKFCLPKGPGRINQVGPTYLPISRRGQLSAYQSPFIGEQKKAAALRGYVNARPVFRCGQAVRTPDLPAGGRFQANQFA